MKTDFKTRYRRNKDILEWLDAVALAVVTVALLSTFCARLVRVDGISMNPGLLDGQRLLITRLLTPDYGDIVVTDSRIDYGKPLIKRVIGKAGDTIDIDFAAGIVYRNGEALDEPYTAEPTYMEEGTEFPLTVPESSLFLMGDNRNHSGDSRSSLIGCIDTRDILGVAVLRLAPFTLFTR